ncbi:MAG TPA: hypothetical protein VG097_05075 [Gemmata sp.]|nr:hypothetical protein [Gemmata sp.]
MIHAIESNGCRPITIRKQQSLPDVELEEKFEKQTTQRGWKRFFLRTFFVLGIVLIGLLLFRLQMWKKGESKLAEVVNQIDNTEQQWTLEEIEAARIARAPPHDQNASRLVLEVADSIPEMWNEWRKQSKWWEPTHDNHLSSPKRVQELNHHRDSTAQVRTQALKLRDLWKGNYTFQWMDNPIAVSLPHLDQAGRVVALLEYDARLAAIDRDPDRGIQAAHAALNVARSIGDEPTLVSQNFRMMFRCRAAVTALGTIANGVPTDGLEELQTAFFQEADERLMLNGLRGERAAFHRMFEGLESSRLEMGNLFPQGGEVGTALAIPAVFEAYRPFLPGDHAEFVRLCSLSLEVAKLPWHEQGDAIKTIVDEKEKLAESIYPITRLIFPPLSFFVERCLRNRAQILITATAIACERFRQQNGRWPRELAEIPKTILPALPQSPFDGQPLSYQVFPNRIALTCYSWPKGSARRAVEYRELKAGPIEFRNPEVPGFGIAVCVWTAEHRGLEVEVRNNK